MKTFMLLALLAGVCVLAHAEVVVNNIGGACGGKGDQAPPHLAADNCWKGYTCNHTKNLVCVRNSEWYYSCETKGSIGPDGKPVTADQCKPTDSGNRKLLADIEGPSELVVAPWGSCGGTGTQTPKDRKPVDGCWANTRCADSNICIKEEKTGLYYQCLPSGSKNYAGEVVTTDACAHH